MSESGASHNIKHTFEVQIQVQLQPLPNTHMPMSEWGILI